MISLRGCSSPSANASTASGISAATPLGPSGSPMSVDVSTSLDSRAERLAELRTERHATHLRHHRHQRAGHGLGLLRQRRRPDRGDLLGHRVAQPLPGVHGVVHPVAAASRPTALVAPAGSAVTPFEPGLGQMHGIGDRRASSSPGWARRTRSSSTPADGPGRSSPGPTSLPRPCLPTPPNISPELGEQLAQIGHVEAAAAKPNGLAPEPDSGSSLPACRGRGRLRWRSRRAGQPCPQRYSPRKQKARRTVTLSAEWAGPVTGCPY